jgi:MFS family permease
MEDMGMGMGIGILKMWIWVWVWVFGYEKTGYTQNGYGYGYTWTRYSKCWVLRYDFFVYGALSTILAGKFFSGANPSAAFVFTLLAFAARFAVRPIRGLIFGRLGDTLGRKYTFLITMTLMGIGTFLIGVLPTFATWGIAAPILLITCRLVQVIMRVSFIVRQV